MQATKAPTGPADRQRFLAGLVDSGRFCRDTRAGRILHPRTDSYREVSDGDSLHVCIDNGGTMSVHVDHFSPVAGRTDEGCCRYTVRAVLAHVASHLAAQVRRVAAGARGRHRCRLECEIVEVDDEVDDEVDVRCGSACGPGHDHGMAVPA